MLVFSRLGTMMMIFPALGETAVPPRVRLVLALSITLIIFTIIRTTLPAIPDNVIVLGLLIFMEIVIGLLIGLSIRLLISALHTAGAVIAMQSGLALAQAFDPVQGSQSAIIATFMTLMGVTLIFITDLHHLMIAAMHDSYTLFPIGGKININDFAELMVRTVSGSFRLGIQIASPFIVYALVFNMGLGILARLMPQFQVFFIGMPLNITFSFVILIIVLGASMTWYLEYMEASLRAFVR